MMTTVYGTRAAAQERADEMVGWADVQVVSANGVDCVGLPVVGWCISARPPASSTARMSCLSRAHRVYLHDDGYMR